MYSAQSRAGSRILVADSPVPAPSRSISSPPTGAALALAALIYAVRGDWPAMFVCLGIALIVDGLDGAFARRLRVAELLPRWSGDVLDLVVDFTTYVFVPAYAIATGGLLPELLALPAGFLIVVTGALYFADQRDEDRGQLFSRLPGALERGRVLSVPVAAGALAGGGHRGGAGGAHLPAVQVHSSDAGHDGCGRSTSWR